MTVPTMSARIALAVLATATAAAHADPLDPARVPADATYVAHLDVDAARPTQLWQAINDRLIGNEQFATQVGQLELGMDMHFPKDVHDVTVYGHAAGQEAAVVVLHAKMNRDRFSAALATLPSYAADTYGKYDLLSFDDHGRAVFAAFHDDRTVIFAGSADNLRAALDTIDDRAPRAAADGPLLAAGVAKPAAGQPPTLAYVSTIDPTILTRPGEQTPAMIKRLAGGSLILTERPASTTRPVVDPADAVAAVRASVRAKDADTADQMKRLAEGFKSVVMLQAMTHPRDADLQFAATASRTLSLTQTGTTVDADASANVAELAKVADRAAEKAKAAK